MDYVDAAVALAHLLSESRAAPAEFWSREIVSSRLLAYEIWTQLHAVGLAEVRGEQVAALFEKIQLVEMTPEVLSRAVKPFPVPLRTLDALHLATMDHLRKAGFSVRLATYDQRLAKAAKALRFDVITP